MLRIQSLSYDLYSTGKQVKKAAVWKSTVSSFPLTIILDHLPEDRHEEAGKHLYSAG